MSESRTVKVERRSGFDKSFRNTLTGNVGTLIPIFFDEIMPDQKVNLKLNVAAALPPLVSDTYMNTRLRVEAFAVPHRLIYGNFEDFFVDFGAEYISNQAASTGAYSFVQRNGAFPLIMVNDGSGSSSSSLLPFLSRGSLLDYLGYSLTTNASIVDYINVAGPACYHLIWNEWYRNPRIQRSCFIPSNATTSIVNFANASVTAANLPFVKCFFSGSNQQPTIMLDTVAGNEPLRFYLLADGVNILSLRQRNFDLDYFTGSMPEPQQGPVAKVAIDSNNEFTISSLRTQNSIQQFRERNNLTSPRYQQQVYARYGVAPTDGVLQRPALLGKAEYDVYSHGVVQTASSSTGASGNPYAGTLGSRGGNAFAAGQDFIIKGFHAKEPMFIMVLVSLVPDVTYAQGIEPVLQRYIGAGSISDMANNILQNVGPQPIRAKELVEGGGNVVFSWSDRYSDWMYKLNRAHGEFKAGGTLQNFVLQRTFSSVPTFGSQFLEIPTDYLDGVMTVTAAAQGFAFWMDSLLEYHTSMPIQEYSIPTLQDPAYEHGRSIRLRKNGQLL